MRKRSLAELASDLPSLPTMGTVAGIGGGAYMANQFLKDADRRILKKAIKKGVPVQRPSQLALVGVLSAIAGYGASSLYNKLKNNRGGYYG